jgi:diguanylate cyclase (GGDEF)-like protein
MWRTILGGRIWRGELRNRRKDGSLYDEEMTITPVQNSRGEITHYIAIKLDITERKQSEERMVHLGHYDALTDLPNRVLLMDRLNQLTKAAQRRKSKVAAVFIDLDRFKEVNDSLGHHAGDVLLQTVAKRFSNAVRGEDTLARIGGVVFVVVIQGLHKGQDAAIIVKELLSCLVKPITLNGYEHTITASMGISLYPDDATNGQELIRNADAAMYQAKGAGRNTFQFYTGDLNQRALEMLSMEDALRRAIERQEFVLHYQPQVDISSGCVVGAEALIRWNHPDLGLVMPGKFISIAEERGLIVPIGSWVIEEAARQAAVWQNSGRLSIPIAVNVSAVQFRQKYFVEQLANSVRKHGINPNRLELELTESIVMRDAGTTVEILKRLHDLGFRLSIDDFGTGYSSLSYLRRFPIDKIKIDQSFVRDVTQDESAASIVTAIISLARSLKLKVIAEGVQTKEQLEILREMRCDEVQGFLFNPALVSGEFEKLVREWEPKYVNWPSLCPIS